MTNQPAAHHSTCRRPGWCHGGSKPLNWVEPLAWLTDVLERMVSGRTKAHELARLLPLVWNAERLTAVFVRTP
jgi:hypothetical protein